MQFKVRGGLVYCVDEKRRVVKSEKGGVGCFAVGDGGFESFPLIRKLFGFVYHYAF